MRWRIPSYSRMSSKHNIVHSHTRQDFLLLFSLQFYSSIGGLQRHSLLNSIFSMRSNVLVSLAFALGVAAGPCKPSASGKFCKDIHNLLISPYVNISDLVTVSSSIPLEPFETLTLSATSSAESSSLQPTTLSTTESVSSDSETFTLSATLPVDASSLQAKSLSATESVPTTTDATTVYITSSVTSDAATLSTIAPISTSSPVLGNFNAIGQGGGASNTPARLPPPQYVTITLGEDNPSGVGAGVFSIEAGTGALFVDGSKICGIYSGSQSAMVYSCSTPLRTNEAPITCEQGQTDGGALKCSAPIMDCIEDFNDDNDPVCYTTGGAWTQFMGFQLFSNYFLLRIGSQAAATGSYVPISLMIQAL